MVSLHAAPQPLPATGPLPQQGTTGLDKRALGTIALGSVRLSLGAQPACGAPAEGALLLIPVSRGLSLRQDTLTRILLPPADLLYLPAEDAEPRAAAFDGWRLELDVPQLCWLASELAEHRLSPSHVQRRLRRAQTLQLLHSPALELVSALRQLLQMAASPALRHSGRLDLLELDRPILRLVVLLLCGEQIDAARQGSPLSSGHRQQVFDDLLAWIEAHLDQPIQLQDLVQQSGYSQRSLRNFFRERCGCGPVQWIRGQRLRNARQRLLNPQPHDTVSGIASAMGYGHPSQFSRDFHQVFGCPPSALLREGRRSQRLG